MRILIGGVAWESLTFSPVKATVDDYGYFRRDQLIAELDLVPIADELGIEPVPSVLAMCKSPGGWSNKEAFLNIRQEILDTIHKTSDLDGNMPLPAWL